MKKKKKEKITSIYNFLITNIDYLLLILIIKEFLLFSFFFYFLNNNIVYLINIYYIINIDLDIYNSYLTVICLFYYLFGTYKEIYL